MRQWTLYLSGAVVLVGAAGAVVTNYATESRPAWLADPVRVWLLLAVLVSLSLIFVLLMARGGTESANPPRPRFGDVAASLRPPTLDREVRGRASELERLRRLSRKPEGKFAVLCGAGGVGKTAVASAVAKQARADGLAVFWIRHRSGADLGGRLAEVAVNTGLDRGAVDQAQRSNAALVELVWGRLEQARGWLLVVDNLDRPTDVVGDGEALREYRGWIRPSRRGLLLVTSRDRHPDTWGPDAELIGLGPLQDDPGGHVLHDLAPLAGTMAEAEELSRKLGGLPLALRAAGAMLSEPTSRYQSFTSYTQALNDRTMSVLPERPDATDPGVARILVGYTWELSLDQLEADGIELARPILRVLSLLANAAIPRDLLTPARIAGMTGAGVTAAAIDSGLAGLHRYGLIDVPALEFTRHVRAVAVHLTVRDANVNLLNKAGNTRAWQRAIDSALASYADEQLSAGRPGWNAIELLAPHLILRSDSPGDDDSTLADACALATRVAHSLAEAGRYQARVDLTRRICAMRVRALGPDHPDTLSSHGDLAAALNDLGRHEEALDLEQQTLATRERVLGPNDPATLTSRADLVATLNYLGRHQEALDLGQEVLEARTRILGSDHRDTLTSHGDLAAALGALGRQQEALDLHKQVLEIRERVLGPDRRETLASRGNLAVSLNALGRYDEALGIGQDVLAARERILGPDHPDTLAGRGNLANTLSHLGRHQEALDLHKQTLATRERILGPGHPQTRINRDNLKEAATMAEKRRWWRTFRK